jgi:hypothetical protein
MLNHRGKGDWSTLINWRNTMRKKITLAFGSVLTLVAIKAIAATLLATPGYVASGCSWNYMGGGYYSPVTVTVTGLYCNGAGPILVKQYIDQPSGSDTCTMSKSGDPALYTYSSTVTCDSYSVSTK